MPGGRARGNPVQIFSEKPQKFPSTDLKNIQYFHVTIQPSFICHMNLGLAPLGLDFSIFGTQCVTRHIYIIIAKNIIIWKCTKNAQKIHLISELRSSLPAFEQVDWFFSDDQTQGPHPSKYSIHQRRDLLLLTKEVNELCLLPSSLLFQGQTTSSSSLSKRLAYSSSNSIVKREMRGRGGRQAKGTYMRLSKAVNE